MNKIAAMLLVYIPIVIGAVCNWIYAVNHSYYGQRLRHAIDPSLDPMGAGYAATTTKSMIERAEWFGRGDPAIHAASVLPEIHTDRLLTFLIHELGWISFIVIMIVLLALPIRAYRLGSRQKSVLGRLVCTAVVVTFTAQVALYAVFNLGVQLVSPLSLPLLSYGGTATIVNMLLIGIMLSVFKSGDIVRDPIRTRNNKQQA